MAVVLQVEGVSRRFGGLLAVNHVSFFVEKDEIFGIIGPNGAGKTTMLNLISNMYTPNTGTILFRGENIVGYAPHRIAKMGLIRTYQSTVSYASSTVWENLIRAQLGYHILGLGAEFLMTRAVQGKKKEQNANAESLLQFLGLTAFRDYEAGSLPYGFQKLLGLAMALAGNPQVLLLDEPAAGLNIEERAGLTNMIKKINGRGITVILVEHDMKVIMGLCHRILVLNYGQKIALGAPAEIQRNEEVIRAYLGEDHEGA